MYGNFSKGIWQFYDIQGNEIQQIDYDKHFKFSWEQIESYLKQRHVELADRFTDITRISEDSTAPVWIISYRTKSNKDGNYIHNITIDGKTGKVLEETWRSVKRN